LTKAAPVLPLEQSRAIRFEFILLGFVLLSIGVLVYAIPSDVTLKDYLGGITSGAGLTVIITELHTRAERKRHQQLLAELTGLREQSEQMEVEVGQIGGQSDELVQSERTTKGYVLATAYLLGYLAFQPRHGSKGKIVPDTQFYSLAEALWISLETAKAASEEVKAIDFTASPEFMLNHSTHSLGRMGDIIFAKYGPKPEFSFGIGTMVGEWIARLVNNTTAGIFELPNHEKWAVNQFIDSLDVVVEDKEVVAYFRSAFQDLKNPSVSKVNKSMLLESISRYMSTPRVRPQIKKLVLTRKMPHDEGYADVLAASLSRTAQVAALRLEG
jgi:hypothetical protein